MTTIYFATNRNGSPRNRPRNFGGRFSDDGLSNLRFGRALVTGKRVRVEVAPEKLAQVDDANLTDTSASTFGSLQLFDELRERMRQDCTETIIFIHGYNVSFKAAMQAAARISQNFADRNDGKGVNVVAFSWPSDGSMKPWLAYASDRRDASASGPAFARGLLKLRDFLVGLRAGEACEQSIHLIAHSMGNYVLRHAVQELRRQSSGGLPRVFDQVFLMAPDEDDDAFEHNHKLRFLPKLARGVNVYFNRGDRAMAISDRTKGNPDRLGDDGPRSPFTVPAKVVQIDCTPVVSGVVEHSYYAETVAVVDDMSVVMNGVDPLDVPGRRYLADRNRFVIQDQD